VSIKTFEFAGLRLADANLEDAVTWITARANAGVPAIVVTPNINHLHLRSTSLSARAAFDAADIQFADGWPLIAASRLLGRPLPGRIAGIDLVGRLVDGRYGLSIAILGGPADTAHRLAERARASNAVVLVEDLAFGWDAPEPRREMLARLQAARPNLVLIGIGAPRQEQLAHDIRSVVGGPILCCGAAIEVLAGLRPRAPELLQRCGLEWAFRLVIEPRRLFRRYALAGASFLHALLVEGWWTYSGRTRTPMES
jgi:N-acetylglucosaminyldiphosphoundecaprenol N-acetyl-beta-D-mannosaminyltransferase